MIDRTARIHPTADVEVDVSVGARTTVWHHAVLRTGATVGSDCIIGRTSFIDEGVTIGDRVKIQNSALVYHGATVEDAVFIGPASIVTNDRRPRSVTRAGDLARASDWTVTPTTLRHGSSLGAGAVLVAGSHLGRFAMVGAGAVVTRPVPAHAVVAGNPARLLGWACACGQRLDELEDARYACRGCGIRYLHAGESGLVAVDGLEVSAG